MVDHYRKGPSPRKFAMDWGLNPHLFNVIKYVARCNHKQYKNQDLHKAIWYLVAELTDDEELCDEVVELVKNTPSVEGVFCFIQRMGRRYLVFPL